ncbi:UDP-N-acetylmuramate--L-alanine ligase [Candidatus Bipolaricaulis anaerobius]|uniref:UDP-N-acetylmuramate--L-alanine ligase n=1 Tax=Candidatus Bipolaricaulis anaerobius TaxID=2026885 RepID=A0A2X3KXQ5_9BACT|nr:UDP-N-acetylmuramate--L-alanine ligase [Candidatus Bipolaricaulis anaerobius]SQD92296.1 UDP-N-acetylmuramate--L-alanine ligase [Candidatus Bipolaricaulis anaerobius]
MNGFAGRVHLIGIGGEGMAALAHLLREGGATISGSDIRDSARAMALRAWAEVHVGHRAEQVPDRVDAIVYSSAISPANPEIRAARGIPCWPRLPALGTIIRGRDLVAVVGTHGKTTTAAWTAHLVTNVTGEGGYYVGGEVPAAPSAVLGRGKPFVAEVDESDGRFVGLTPRVAVLTSVDTDHIGTYGGFAGLRQAFARFVARADRVAVCADDPIALDAARSQHRPLTYGLSPHADLRAVGVEYHRERSNFELLLRGDKAGEVEVPGPGPHNVLNALGALAAGVLLDIPLRDLVLSLPTAARPRRRLEVLEENGYLVVDDYAHHPTEVAAGLAALRLGWPDRRIVAIFQPHRYSRTQALAGAFGTVLARADQVVVSRIYPAFERPIPGVSGRDVAEAICGAGGNAVYRDSLDAALDTAAEAIQPGDVVACFGAGDIWKLAREMAHGLSYGS